MTLATLAFLNYVWLLGLGLIVVWAIVADALRGFPEQDDADLTYDPFRDWQPK